MLQGFLKILESKKKSEKPRKIQYAIGKGTQKTHTEKPKISSTRKRRSRLPLKAVIALDDWFSAHKDKPYPSEVEKSQLMLITGLSRHQINNWFMNTRKRRGNQQDPLDAWLSDSSESEAASEEDIAKAATNLSLPPVSSRTRLRKSKSASSSGSSFASAFDQCPEARRRRGPRQGRRHMKWTRNSSLSSINQGSEFDTFSSRETLSIPENISIDELPSLSSATKPCPKKTTMFQCTFCKVKLSEKAWKRHEETRHLPRREWKCLAEGKFLQKDRTCVFCRTLIPIPSSNIHPEQCPYRLNECMSKSPSQRTFYRKQHLLQHIHRYHKATVDSKMITQWESSTNEPERLWDCGFCGEKLFGWDARAAHISIHFRKGLDMSSWNSKQADSKQDTDYEHDVDLDKDDLPIFWDAFLRDDE